VLDFNGIRLREISIGDPLSFIVYISVGPDSKIYMTDAHILCSIEDKTGYVKQFTSPETKNRMGKLVMDTSINCLYIEV
jgi:hypothetical protein